MSAQIQFDSKQSKTAWRSLTDQSIDSSSTSVEASASVVVVDDDPQILELVSRMVVRLGYRCTTAADELDALFYLKNNHHKLLITDYDMPFMDGFQLAEQVKRLNSSTKVIVMTGHSETVLKAGRMGSTNVDGLLIKPFGLNAMREKIEEVFRPHRSDGANQPNPRFCGKGF